MRNLNRLEKYALTASALSASLVGAANAAVVTSGPVNIVAPATSAGVYLNVITGQTAAASFAGYDVNVYGSTLLQFFSAASGDSTGYVRLGTSPTSGNTTVANLSAGRVIGNLAGMWFGNGNASTTAPFVFNLNSTNNYVGFRFANEATGGIHYGWFRLSIGATASVRSIIEYAYEDVAGASILVPAPGAVALLGLAGLVGTRRRRG